MWLLVGLGNPGKEYDRTRHNAGWIVLDHIAATAGAQWREDKKNNALVCDGVIAGEKVIMLKPLSYMNLSGGATQAIAAFYKIDPAHVIVLHDDMDFPLGTIKAQFDRSSAGHNGVTDIIERLGTQAFHRIRIGIGPKQIDGRDFVLEKFTPAEDNIIREQLDNAGVLVKDIITHK